MSLKYGLGFNLLERDFIGGNVKARAELMVSVTSLRYIKIEYEIKVVHYICILLNY